MSGTYQKAIIQTKYGLSQKVLEWKDHHPVQKPNPNEVQIRVYTTSLNPINWQTMEGNRKLIHYKNDFFDL